MAYVNDWTEDAAYEIEYETKGTIGAGVIRGIIVRHCPFKPEVAYVEVAVPTEIQHSLVVEFKRVLSEDEWRAAVDVARTIPGVQGLRAEAERRDGPLLQCIDCRNTESPAGAMARYFNHGRCLHCGGYFKVVRA